MKFSLLWSNLQAWWYASGDMEYDTLRRMGIRISRGHAEQRGEQFAWVQDDPGYPPEK